MTLAGTSRSLYRYTSRRERATRILVVIAFAYALMNGSRFNVLNGFYIALTYLVGNLPVSAFWSWIGIALVVTTAIGLFAFMERRWKLARTQTDIPLLALMTLSLVGIVGIVVAILGNYFQWDWHAYWIAFQWTWQVPAGFFVGKGLNWSVVDRQIAGVQAVDSRDTQGEGHHVDTVDVVVDHQQD